MNLPPTMLTPAQAAKLLNVSRSHVYRLYSHTTPNMQEEAARRMDAVLRGTG